MNNGLTFIADNMNLSTAKCMKALAPALEPNLGEQIFIPGVDELVFVNSQFFFIAYQNELSSIGTNAIPDSISSRFRYFNYPKQTESDILNICWYMAKKCYRNGEQMRIMNEADSRLIGKYMIELNNLRNTIIPQWSFRDIAKLFKRIHHQDTYICNFYNLTFYHNVLFYTLSAVNSDNNYVLDDVIDLIVKIFLLNDDKRNELRKCYLAKPVILKKNCSGIFVMKDSIGISLELYPLKLASLINLNSLSNSAFQLLLADPSEPILLMGNSGFKTFLAKQFLHDAKIINLNQELTVSHLLGFSYLFTNTEARLFYLENICKICNLYDEYIELRKKLLNKTLMKEEIKELINGKIQIIPISFHYAIKHLTEKLFKKEKRNNVIISNSIFEFKPGLLLSTIFERKSLILKNVSNFSTNVLVRFNELFSKHILTLEEDIHNTFTSRYNKEFINFNQNFRVMATSPLYSPFRLSNGVLSNFTIVFIPKYKLEEQVNVIQSYMQINQINYKNAEIELLQTFSQEFNEQFGKHFEFQQMLKSIEMHSILSPETLIYNSQTKFKLGLIIYRLCSGLLENQKERKKLIELFKKLNINLPTTLQNFNEEPLEKCEQNNCQGYKSKITGFFIENTHEYHEDSKIAFTGKFTEMVDILHLGLITHTPIIFEGKPGQGKQTAINYIANLLGYEVININISRSTNVDDLFGKLSLKRDKNNELHVEVNESKLVKAIKSKQNNIIIVFHNINNASVVVLEVITSIFDTKQKQVLLPNGSVLEKGNLNLVAIFDPQNCFSGRDRLPSSLMYSSIYYIVLNPKKDDIFNIINKQFEGLPYDNEAHLFYRQFMITNNICKELNATQNIILNDISKYILFRNITYDSFDKSIVLQILFVYRFI